MIIQCEQCNTKFKLDDAKVPDKGIKVRCAKCKQVFMVQRETPHEEPDLDFLLSGLGAETAAAEKEPAQAGAVVSPVAEEEELQPPAQSPEFSMDAMREPAAGVEAEQARGEEFSEDFFAAKEEVPVPEEKDLDYGDFSFDEEEAKAPAEEVTPPAGTSGSVREFDFGEFPTGEESIAPTAPAETQKGVPEEKTGIEFGEVDFSFESEPAQAKGEGVSAGIAPEEPAADEFVFEEDTGVSQADIGTKEEKPDELADTRDVFDFSEIVPPADKEKGAADNASVIAEDEGKAAGTESTDFETFEFGEVVAPGQAAAKEEESKTDFDFSSTPVAEKSTEFDFAAREKVAEPSYEPSFASQMPSVDDELPPLAISTRKRGRSIFSIAVTVVAALIVLAVAGVGFYVYKEGPAAFNKLGLSFLAKWTGMEKAEEGGITIKNPQGVFMVNRQAGEIFVVSGEAVNNFKKPRASIQVKAVVLGPKGEVLMQKTAYCGNGLSREQLATLPMQKIEESMGSPFGDSLVNLGVQPGKGIPFVVVFNGVQKSASEFSVEVVGSTAADQ